MTTVLLSALLTLLPSAPIPTPPPPTPTCPWDSEALSLVWPPVHKSWPLQVPSNASFWFRANDGITSVGLARPIVKNERGEEIELEETRTVIPTGRMLQLKPKAELTPGNRYTLEFALREMPIAAVAPIAGIAARAEVTRIVSLAEAAAGEGCTTTGVLITPHVDRADLHLFIDGAGEVLAVSALSAFVVAGTEGDQICGRLVSINAAGERSEPSDEVCAVAGAARPSPTTAGRSNRTSFGKLDCTTTEGAGGEVAAIFALMLGLVWLGRRRTSR